MILVVDDDEPTCSSVKRILESRGYEVTVAHDVDSATTLLAQVPFQTVLCDYYLGTRRGSEILVAAKVMQPTCRRVLMSAHRVTPEQRSAAQPQEFLNKPLDLGELLQALGTPSVG